MVPPFIVTKRACPRRSYDEVTPQKILDLYNQRNFTTRFDVPYPAWTVQPPVTIGNVLPLFRSLVGPHLNSTIAPCRHYPTLCLGNAGAQHSSNSRIRAKSSRDVEVCMDTVSWRTGALVMELFSDNAHCARRYFAMFVIVYVLCYAIKLLVYPNQVFETEVIIDQGAYRGPKQHNF